MKKLNKNILLFVLVMLFLLSGLWTYDLAYTLSFSAKEFAREILAGNANALQNLTVSVDSTSELLKHHDALLDLNSVKENLLGTRVVDKGETVVVKTDADNLVGYLETRIYTEEENQARASAIARIKEIANENEAGFLYCAVAKEVAYETLPPNVTQYNCLNQENFLRELAKLDVPVLDTAEVFDAVGMDGEDIFFKTDHHWKPASGFRVSGAICQELQRRYGFQYDPAHIDLNSYNVTTLENWFLGSYGKKVGTYFADWTVDDFDVIIPSFPTEFIEEVSTSDRIRTGTFEDTMLYADLLEKDYYHSGTYSAYSGGDYRLQKITNCTNPDGKKIMVIRQSFGCVVTPFLAIHASELHVVDDREGGYPEGEIIDIEAYIQSVKPDYVVVIK